jgi:hypothetical protein
MTVQEIIERLNLEVVTAADLSRQVTGGYASDLLSCVMAGAKAGNVWVTLQAHPNVVAVASLLDLAAVVITEGITPDAETTAKAEQNSVTLLKTQRPTFVVVGELVGWGVRGVGAE